MTDQGLLLSGDDRSAGAHFGGVHGNESQGARVVESLRSELERMCARGSAPFYSTWIHRVNWCDSAWRFRADGLPSGKMVINRVGTVQIALDNLSYEIDLSAPNAAR